MSRCGALLCALRWGWLVGKKGDWEARARSSLSRRFSFIAPISVSRQPIMRCRMICFPTMPSIAKSL